MNKNKQIALRALENHRGDDLSRARARFRDLSEQQMHKPYAQSGKTPAEIIASYQAHEDAVNAAIKWVESLPE